MRLVTFLAACVFATATVADTWRHVRGGTWTPEPQTVERAQAAVQAQFVSSTAEYREAHGDATQPYAWADYEFQYQGITHEGERVVIVSAYCPRYIQFHGPLTDAEILIPSDGGSCFFHALYDPRRDQVTRLRFNGIG